MGNYLAAIQHCLDQSLHRIQEDLPSDVEWSYKILKDALLKSAAMLDYFVAQKFAINNPPRESTTHEDEEYDWHRLRWVLELPAAVITPSIRHIFKSIMLQGDTLVMLL